MPEIYKGIGQGFSVASKEGALLLGWMPTLFGYSAQGMFKFGLYEIFKVGGRGCRGGRGEIGAIRSSILHPQPLTPPIL